MPKDDNLLIVMPIQSKKVAGVNLDDGAERWRVDVPFAAMSYVMGRDCVVIAGTSGEICGISFDGELLWHNELDGFGLGVPLLAIPGVTKAGKQ